MPECLCVTELRWRLHHLLKSRSCTSRRCCVHRWVTEDSYRWSGPTLHLLKELNVQEELYPSLGEDSYRWSSPTLHLLMWLYVQEE